MTYSPKPNRPLMAALGVVNRHAILRGRFRIQAIDLPAEHRARLERAVNPTTAAFLAPNHPEFGLDWMIDKELSTRFAPRMASWASHSIVASAPWFWSRNNLVSNRGGADAREYSVQCALAGHSVLLHPEGMVRWTSDVVHPLFRGIAALAVEAARRSAEGDRRPVYIVPLVWKVRHTRDASAGMHEDMDVIERELGLPSGARMSVSERFGALHRHIAARRPGELEFDPAAFYTSPTLTQEHVYECLKRLRAELVKRTRRHVLHNFLPRPYGPRVAHVRVPEPIRVDPERAAADPDSHGAYVESLLVETRAAMQSSLDEVNREIAPDVDRFRHPNPFVAPRVEASSRLRPYETAQRGIHCPSGGTADSALRSE